MRVIILVFITLCFTVSSVTHAQAIKSLSAGVSEEGRQAHKEYSVKLVFFARGGSYVANVKVVIQNDKGEEVFTGNFSGPWFSVDFPAGKYRVTAIRQSGNKQGVRVTVDDPASQKMLALMFLE